MKLITSEMDAETEKWQESSAQMEVSSTEEQFITNKLLCKCSQFK